MKLLPWLLPTEGGWWLSMVLPLPCYHINIAVDDNDNTMTSCTCPVFLRSGTLGKQMLLVNRKENEYWLPRGRAHNSEH